MAESAIIIDNTDPGVRSMYANLEKESNGEKFRTLLINTLNQVERIHRHNVDKQHDICIAWEIDFDPMPIPIVDRRLIQMPLEDEWGHYSQVDQDGNITMP